MSDKVHTCPRRIADGMDDASSPLRGAGADLDTWRSGKPLGGSERIAPRFRSCSYCGSMHPDDFMDAARNGDVIGPTDKSYKAYVGKPYSDEDWDQYKERLGADFDQGVRPARDYAKFYFQHLSPDQQREFIDLLNGKRITVGYPGRFYRLPFFITYGEPAT